MELPRPEPGLGEVLVRLHAAGVNPFDWKVVDGILKDVVPHGFPLVVGMDGAGEVIEVGRGITRFQPGDAVYGQFMRLPQGGGSYAEFAVADESAIALAPRSVGPAEAAAIPTAGMTAANVLAATGVVDGVRVLIVGATGGVGTFATQLAAGRGAHVIVTARAASAELMRGFGAREVVDHTTGSVADQVRAAHPDGVDVLIDLVSDRAALTELAGVVRDGGTVASTIGAADVEALTAKGLRASNFQNTSSAALLDALAVQVDSGLLTAPIGREVSLDEAPAALADSRTGRAAGKTVILLG
ncbi:NADP-dependent oxidoreductase [Solihabitans fulvus]|uniref:NADP-dependent oxidoreductase n=2 Tax=Solihabitans fulvus TaxID=1892852 RepID=A0A5B2XUF5_9PSEU|nr:NADP-dependent oxidoreductase [Solihabitans fulvus]